jgi:glyoxylase-like metal-dependent hydrolase (beta-lactamase superfamily II)
MYYLSWYEIRQIAEQTYAIQEPSCFEETISYLVIGSDLAVLINSGMGVGNIKDVVSSLTDKPIQVINTSSNWENVGGNCLFDDILIHEADASHLEHPPDDTFLQCKLEASHVWRSFPDGFVPDEYSISPSKATRLLHDGDLIDLGDRLINVIHTPGNTPGSICILDSQYAQLFTGDTLYLGDLHAHRPLSNLLDYHDSIIKLSSCLPFIDHILPGYNMTPLKASFISNVSSAFDQIMAKEVSSSQDKKGRFFDFEQFSIYVKDIVH